MTGITAGYVILVAALMLYVSEAGAKVSGVVFGEVVFATPMLAAWSVAKMINRPASRNVILVFAIGYVLFSAFACFGILTGEHDAQWQLEFLFIPMAGFFAVLIFGWIAATWRRPAKSRR